MAAITGTTVVPAPQVTPAKVGLYDVADVVPAEARETNGVTFETELGFDLNLIDDDAITCIATAEKDFDGLDWESGSPFTIYAGVQCNLFLSDDYEARAVARLGAGESRAVESYLWESVFPDRAADLTPSAGAVSGVIGLGILEEYAGEHYLGKPVIHIGKRGAVSLVHDNLISDDGGTAGIETKTGSDFVNGAGYTSIDDGPLVHHAAIAAPVITKGAAQAGGTFPVGTYFWKVTAINAHGETIGSNEVTATLTLNQEQILNWTAITGATGYNIYRGVAAGAETVLVASVGAVATYTDTGINGTAGSVPTTNTTAFDTNTAAGDGEVWMYITGQITIRRGPVISNTVDAPTTNDRIALAERTIVPTVDVLAAAIRITLE